MSVILMCAHIGCSPEISEQATEKQQIWRSFLGQIYMNIQRIWNPDYNISMFSPVCLFTQSLFITRSSIGVEGKHFLFCKGQKISSPLHSNETLATSLHS